MSPRIAAALVCLILLFVFASGFGAWVVLDRVLTDPQAPGRATLATEATPAITAAVGFGREFSLKLGQRATLEDGLAVTFVDVPTDGRCSSCTASYYAEIVLRLEPPRQAAAQVVLWSPPYSATPQVPSPYEIKYVGLQPQKVYPNDTLDVASYVLSIVVSKSR